MCTCCTQFESLFVFVGVLFVVVVVVIVVIVDLHILVNSRDFQ